MENFLLVVCIALMPLLAAATAQVNYPLDQQLPPVARVGSPFSFQFAPTTFSGSPNLHYSLIGNPSWLSLDDESRTLIGTPRPSDAGFATFNITATGEDGTAASMGSRLFIATGNAPVAKANLSDILSSAGQLSGPKTVVLKPSKPFTIAFPPDSFDSNGTTLSYFAMLSDHTPLPAWIRFDAPTRRFIGTTTSTTAPQSMEILLIASDTPGFAASSLSFTLATSAHILVFKPFSQTINATRAQALRIPDLKQKLFLDDFSMGDSKLQSASAIMPSWLTFDNKSLAISGTAPADTTSRDLVIIARDQFGNIAEYTVHLLFESEFFTSNLENLHATLGEHFTYIVPRTILARQDENVTINFTALADYLTFDPSTFTIAGTIPTTFAPQTVDCSVTATSTNGGSNDTQTFYIDVSRVSATSQPGIIGSSDTQRRMPKVNRDGIIAGVVIGSLIIGLLLLWLAFILHRKRRVVKNCIGRKPLKNPRRKSKISRPIPIPSVWPENDMELNAEDDLEKGKDVYDQLVDTPRLDLNIAANRKDRDSVTESIGDMGTRILDIFEESPYGIHNDTSPSQHPHESMKLATELAKQGSHKCDHFRKHKRRTTTVYQDQIHRSTGLPVHRRITGMGHGRHTSSPSRSNTNFPSRRRPLSASSYMTRGTSIASFTSSAFPRSPATRKHRTLVTTPTEERRSIRVVPNSRRSSLPDRRTADEKRSAYIRNRASAESPFFSAGIRASSSTYTSPPAFIHETKSSNGAPRATEHTQPVPDLVASSSQEFPGSLRKYRTTHPHTAMSPPRIRVEKAYNRPGTSIGTGFSRHHRRTSTLQSFRAYDLKASLNDLTGSKIFEDADMSDSIYSAEERDIEEAEQQKTVTPSQYTLPPLNLDRVDTTRSNKRIARAEKKNKKKKGDRDGRRELKSANEQDPTPYFFVSSSQEHGGKENVSSSYNTGHRSTPARSEAKGKFRATSSPKQPKPPVASQASAGETGKSPRIGQTRTPKTATYQEKSIKERQSRVSLHSGTPCRQSNSVGSSKRSSNKLQRIHSRPQSSAYPLFDSSILDSTVARPSPNKPLPSPPAKAINMTPLTTSGTEIAHRNTEETGTMMRDLSGNLTFYGMDEEPTIEQLDSSSIAFRSNNGTISSTARQSRLAGLHLSSQSPPPPPKSEKRKTVVAVNSSVSSGGSAGLSFFPHEMPGDGRREVTVQVAEEVSRTGRGSVEGKQEEEEGIEGEQGNSAWGNIRTVLGKSSKWVGGGYWEGRGKEEKVFL